MRTRSLRDRRFASLLPQMLPALEVLITLQDWGVPHPLLAFELKA
ncbi:MAG TPA: hypothetical protein VGB45_02705 [Abditibacterium sp.]